jgi:MarR family 2-MHQ and catechol resistance regulon transcriptional repressor
MTETDPVTTPLELWAVLNRTLRTIEQRLARHMEAHGLSLTEFGVLQVLRHQGPLPIGEIGSRVRLTSGSMTYVVDKLTQRGLLARTTGEADRRRVHVTLTAQGRALMDVAWAAHVSLIRTLTGGLQPDEQVAAAALLQRLACYAERQEAPGTHAAVP